MSESMESVKQSSPVVKQSRSTLVRRVSGMFKDGKSSGPPLLFRHASMQRLRHCCQNLNLFPYLLYSFGNSKSHPTVQKMYCQIVLLMHNFSVLVQNLVHRILETTPVANSVRFAIGFQRVLLKHLHSQGLTGSYSALNTFKNTSESPKSETIEPKAEKKFSKFVPKQRKRISIVLTIAVYSALVVLASQLVGIFSVMLFGKYPPGFIFLMSALLFLGYITLKIMAFDKAGHGFKEEKRKTE